MNRLLLLTPLLTILASPVAAQTILSLSATGEATAPPDEAVAHFQAQATKPDAAAAQAAVNQAVAKALTAARTTAGVTVTTSFYNTYSVIPENQTKPAFTAEQSLTLVQPDAGGIPDAAFTSLLTKLQSDGLLLTGLSGDLSSASTAKLQQEAVRNALNALREEAKNVADTLHKKVGDLQSLTVGTDGGPVPPLLMGARAMAMAAPPPQSAPDNVSVTAHVNAKIELDSGS